MTSTLTVNVPESMQEEVSGWQDGQTYEIEIKQTGEGQFDLSSIEPASEEASEDSGPETESKSEDSSGGMDEMMGDKKSPVAILIASKKAK